jgi:hypothetical protein
MTSSIQNPSLDLSTPSSTTKLVVTSTLVFGILIAFIMPWFWRKKLAFAGKVRCIPFA